MYFFSKISIKSRFGCIFLKEFDKIAFLANISQKGQQMSIFFAKKWQKKKYIYFWQAKSAVERPFGHLSFGNFVKIAFFQYIFIDFRKKLVFGIFWPSG